MAQRDQRQRDQRPHDPNNGPNKGPNKGESGRKGTWVEIKTFEDPDSKMSIIVSERIRGAPAYSFQLAHIDDIGVNKYVPIPCPGAKHKPEDIAFSLVLKAREFVEARTKDETCKNSDQTKGSG